MRPRPNQGPGRKPFQSNAKGVAILWNYPPTSAIIIKALNLL